MLITRCDKHRKSKEISQRARAYMCAYLALEKEKEITTEEQKKKNKSTSVLVKIEQMVKQFKMHWCALCFDGGLINSVIMMSTGNDVEERSSKWCQ
jgi:hypothetical protein